MTGFGFDVTTAKPSASPDPLPPGWYAMRVLGAMQVQGKSQGTGQMLKIEFEVLEHAHPQYARRKVFANFCHQHDNRQTRDIARSNIAAILHAIGKPTATSIDDMLGCELRVKLNVQPASNGYEAKNEAKGFKSLADVEPAQAAPASEPVAAAAPKPAAAASPARQPWKR